jgi:outer membrane receptor protein involved in Fe transport
LRVASADSAARLTWLAGLFYLKRRENNFQDTYTILAPTVPGILSDDNDSSTEISAFGQARWSFTSRLSLGAGMRIGRFHNESYDRSGGSPIPEPPPSQRPAIMNICGRPREST